MYRNHEGVSRGPLRLELSESRGVLADSRVCKTCKSRCFCEWHRAKIAQASLGTVVFAFLLVLHLLFLLLRHRPKSKIAQHTLACVILALKTLPIFLALLFSELTQCLFLFFSLPLSLNGG